MKRNKYSYFSEEKKMWLSYRDGRVFNTDILESNMTAFSKIDNANEPSFPIQGTCNYTFYKKNFKKNYVKECSCSIILIIKFEATSMNIIIEINAM